MRAIKNDRSVRQLLAAGSYATGLFHSPSDIQRKLLAENKDLTRILFAAAYATGEKHK